MEQKRTLSIILGVVWWLITLFVGIAILHPIYDAIGWEYPFYRTHILFIITFSLYLRFIFLLKYSILDTLEYFKVGIILLSPIILFFLVSKLYYFQIHLDEQGTDGFLGQFNLARQQLLGGYIQKVMFFFGVGSILMAIIFPFRLVWSIWKNRNK